MIAASWACCCGWPGSASSGFLKPAVAGSQQGESYRTASRTASILECMCGWGIPPAASRCSCRTCALWQARPQPCLLLVAAKCRRWRRSAHAAAWQRRSRRAATRCPAAAAERTGAGALLLPALRCAWCHAGCVCAPGAMCVSQRWCSTSGCSRRLSVAPIPGAGA